MLHLKHSNFKKKCCLRICPNVHTKRMRSWNLGIKLLKLSLDCLKRSTKMGNYVENLEDGETNQGKHRGNTSIVALRLNLRWVVLRQQERGWRRPRHCIVKRIYTGSCKLFSHLMLKESLAITSSPNSKDFNEHLTNCCPSDPVVLFFR